MGGEGEGSGVKGGGKWELGTPCPPPHILSRQVANVLFKQTIDFICISELFV